MKQLFEKISVRVVIVEGSAYWVSNDIFYTAKLDELGNIDLAEAGPVDVFSASEKEAKKLLKILDSIKE